jgi:hypothetical protein
MVTPERMLMSSFPANASLIPSSFRMGCATCGLQLNTKKNEVGGGRVSRPITPRSVDVVSWHIPQQDDVGLLHRQDVLLDGDLDGFPSDYGSKFLAQAPRTFFAPYAGNEARRQRGVNVGEVGGGRGTGSVGLPFGLAGN